MTNSATPTPDRASLLAGMRAITQNTVQEAGDNETGRGMELIQQLLDGLPVATRKRFNDHFEACLEAGELQRDPMVAMVTLLNGNSPTEFTQIPALSGTIDPGAAIAAPAADTSVDESLSPRETTMLEVFRKFGPSVQTWWEDQMRGFTALSRDEQMGATNAIESIVERKLALDTMGRPLAEGEVQRLTKEKERLERELTDLKRKNIALEGEVGTLKTQKNTLTGDLDSVTTERNNLRRQLDNARPTPAPMPVVDNAALNELRDTVKTLIERIYRGTLDPRGIQLPGVNLNDIPSLKAFLAGQFPTDIETAVTTLVNQLNGNVELAKKAYRGLDKVTASTIGKGVSGRGAVQERLLDIIDPTGKLKASVKAGTSTLKMHA